MSNVAPPPPAPAATKNRRSRAEQAEIDRAKKTLAALPKLLSGIAEKDAHAAKVRIDQAWVDQYASFTAGAESSSDGRAVARVDLKAATAQERKWGTELAALLIDVRGRVQTHAPTDTTAQEAYGRGAKIDGRRTGPLLTAAGNFVAAFAGKWKQAATDSGVTEATMSQIQALRSSLSSADIGQHGVLTSNADGTVNRAALFKVLRSMSAFAVKVVQNVFGRTSTELRSLSDPRPLTSRGAARKSATKAAKKQKAAAAKAKKAAKPKQRAAAAKRRSKLAAVAARASTLTAAPQTPAKKTKAAKKKTKK